MVANDERAQGRGEAGEAITPEVEIAWARAISYAFDDPAFERRLRADKAGVLREFGVEVTEDHLEDALESGRLGPKLETLAKANQTLERQRAAVRGAQQPASRASGVPPISPSPAPGVSTQPGIATYAGPIHIHATASPYGSMPYAPINPYTVGCNYASFTTRTCVYASQVATTRTHAVTATGPPQWIGGPPSGATDRAR